LFRLGEGNSEGNDPGQNPGSVLALLGRGHAIQLRKELLAVARNRQELWIAGPS